MSNVRTWIDHHRLPRNDTSIRDCHGPSQAGCTRGHAGEADGYVGCPVTVSSPESNCADGGASVMPSSSNRRFTTRRKSE